MKSAAFALVAVLIASPAYAQLGGLINKAQRAKETKDKIDDMNISDREERQLGEQVSASLLQKYGVYQDKDVTKYVTLVGNVLARQSSRPDLDWTYIILDTDGVNAFATPGGLVHVTRGLLGLVKNEAELSGILGHEITHITAKHTIRAIQQAKGFSVASDLAGGGSLRDRIVAEMARRAFTLILNGEFSRDDENESDKAGIQLANKLGYAPSGLMDVLKKIDARNAGREERNGMFASHPAAKDRIAKLDKQITAEKLAGTAKMDARYTKTIAFDAKPVTEIAMNVEGAAGLAGGDGKEVKKEEEKKAEPRKKGGLIGRFSTSNSEQKQSSQTVASAGARGGVPDRDAKGGPNKSPVRVPVTPAEIEAFKKDIAA